MKILIVVFNYYPSVGGTQIFFQRVAEEFVNRYNDLVEVYTTDSFFGPNKIAFKKISKQSEIINGVKVTRFPFKRWHKKPFILLKKIIAKVFKQQSEYINQRLIGPWSTQLQKAINATDADVIIASSSSFMYMGYAVKRKTLKHPKPFIFQGAIHFKNKFRLSDFPKKTLEAMKAADIYWSNTNYESAVVKSLGVDQKKIKLTATGIDLTDFKNAEIASFKFKHNISNDEIIIVCLGRIDAFKGIDIFLKSIVHLFKSCKNFKAIVAGKDFGYLETLKKFHADLPVDLQHKILFLESLSNNEKSNLCNAMDMLVLPSVNESFGMVFLEAWACKKPVIGANIGAVASVINNDFDGLLFEPNNTEDLSLKMLKLIADKPLRETFGMNGYKKVIENYTWDKVSTACRQTCFDAMENFKNFSS